MAVAIIPFKSSVGYYDFDTSINDVSYMFVVRWNERDNIDQTTGKAIGAWYFDMYEADGNVVAEGLKAVIGTYIGRTRAGKHPFFRDGVLAAIDTSGGKRDPGFDDIGPGKRVEIRYYTIQDLITEVYGL